jgi:hypothetical protein
MPTVNKGRDRVVEIVPKDLQRQVDGLQVKIDKARKEHSILGSVSSLEARVASAKEDLKRISDDADMQMAAAADAMELARLQIADDERAFAERCKLERQAITESCTEAMAQIAQARAILEADEVRIGALREAQATERADLDVRSSAVVVGEDALAAKARSLAEREDQADKDKAALLGSWDRVKAATEQWVQRQTACGEDEIRLLSLREDLGRANNSIIQGNAELANRKAVAIAEDRRREEEARRLAFEAKNLAEEKEAFTIEKNRVVRLKEDLGQRDRLLAEESRKQGERESRILALEASVREQERRLEQVREQLRVDFLKLEQAKVPGAVPGAPGWKRNA